MTRHGASPEALERMRRVREELRERPQVPFTLDQVQERPTFTPMTVRPQLRNRDEVLDALARHYPPLLRSAGIEGTVNVWFLIDETGAVDRALLHQGSGYEALDQAALRVARVMEFSPAYNRDVRVPVWVSLPITFERPAAPDPTPAPALAARAGEAPRTGAPPSEMPSITPMTVRPQLRNVSEVRQALASHYPPLLRDAAITGTTNVWLFIDETGTVIQTRLHEGSGHPALDAAALRVVERMRFEPARNGAEAVGVWISLPVTFEIQ